MRAQGLRLDQSPPLDVPLRFFLTAPLFGVAAGVLLAAGGRGLLLSPFLPGTIALTHLVTLGWISMVMVGALYQITPVLLGAVVPAIGLARWVHLGLTLGVVGLAGGMLGGQRGLLVAGGALLALALLVFLGQLGAAFLRSPTLTVSGFSIRLSVASLVLAAALGLTVLGEHVWGWLPWQRQAVLALHVFLALGGWVGGLIHGVGYAVIPMFYLAVPFSRWRGWLPPLLLLAALVLAPPVLFWGAGRGWLALPLGAGFLAMALFAVTVFQQLARRKRRVADPTLRFWQTGLVAGPAALALAVGYLPWPDPRLPLAAVGVFLVGFAGAIENGMTFKIIPFLVWLHRFSAVAGTMRVPLMTDILPKRHAAWQWRAHLAALLLLAGALLYPADGLARAAGVGLALNCAYWFLVILRAARYRVELVPLNRPPRETEKPAGVG